jgi:hypothetical protein
LKNLIKIKAIALSRARSFRHQHYAAIDRLGAAIFERWKNSIF